jgi:uncharacterized protein
MKATGQALHTASKPWYRHLWPWLLLLGPFLVVVAGCITAWVAFTRQDALVVDDYYKQGKAINQDLHRDRAAMGLALQANLRYDAASGRLDGNITSHGKPYAGKVKVRMVHSTLPEKDFSIDAEAGADGGFSAPLPMLEMARWQVMIEGADREWRLNQIWKWPNQKQIVLNADAAPRN